MTKYQEIIDSLKKHNPAQAEYIDEEINIIIHKLKFLSQDNFPKTIVLNQQTNFEPMQDAIIEEKVKVAGGRFISHWIDNPDCIIIVQSNESLYSHISDMLNNPIVTASSAYQQNNIYIIQENSFNTDDTVYLRDAEILAEILQPKYFVYGHDGSAWVKFDVK